MAYSRVTWEDGQTALSAEHMNNIEEGIGEALVNAKGNNDMWSYIRNLVYPVGSIYMSVNNTDPGELFGGIWEAWGSGRVPVGVDGSQAEFDTVEEKGGAKTVTLTSAQSGVPAHYHGVGTIVAKLINHVHTIAHTHTLSHTHTMAHTHSVSGNTGDAGSHSHTTGNDTYTRWAVTNSTTDGFTNDTYNVIEGTTYKLPRVNAAYGWSTRTATNSTGSHHHSVSLTTGGSSAANTGSASTSTTSAPSNANSGNPTALNNCTMSGSTANNTAANAASAHTNLQPYITCFMYKRIA